MCIEALNDLQDGEVFPIEVQEADVEESGSFLANYIKGLLKDQFLDL